jgi:hypothetical protein
MNVEDVEAVSYNNYNIIYIVMICNCQLMYVLFIAPSITTSF